MTRLLKLLLIPAGVIYALSRVPRLRRDAAHSPYATAMTALRHASTLEGAERDAAAQTILAQAQLEQARSKEQAGTYWVAVFLRASLLVGDRDAAESYARELLVLADDDRAWDRGNARHEANIALGKLALTRDDVDAASAHMIAAAARTARSPQLSTLGPDMSLARDLLLRGVSAPVLRYIDACRSMWRLGRIQLWRWSRAIRRGRVPDFGAHLTRYA